MTLVDDLTVKRLIINYGFTSIKFYKLKYKYIF